MLKLAKEIVLYLRLYTALRNGDKNVLEAGKQKLRRM